MTPKFSIVNVWASRTAELERSCGLKSSFPGGYASMTFSVVGNSLLNASRYWCFKADGGIRPALALAAGFGGFPFGLAAFRRAGRLDLFFMIAFLLPDSSGR